MKAMIRLRDPRRTTAPRLLLSGVLAFSVLATGCSALRVSTGEGESGPVNVGVGEGASGSADPSASVGSVPPGMAEVSVDLGTTCPIPVSLAMDAEWNGDTGYDGFRLFTRGSGAIITVNCYLTDDAAPEAVVESARNSAFSESGSRVLAEETGEITGGSYWTVRGYLGPEEMAAIDGAESTLYAAVVGVRSEGRQYKVSVDMVAERDDAASRAQFEQMLPTVTVDGQRLTPPQG